MTAVCEKCAATRLCCDDCQPEVERAAALIWREENPEMSVFDCSNEMKNEYRRRVLDLEIAL